MQGLIDALLSLAQISRAPIRKGHVDLTKVATEVAQEIAEQQSPKHVDVLVQPGLCCLGDERLIRQIYANLLGNAWKFTSGEASRVNVGMQPLPSGENAFLSATMGSGSMQPRRPTCSLPSSGTTSPTSSRAPASAWQPSIGSCPGMAGRCGQSLPTRLEPRSSSLCRLRDESHQGGRPARKTRTPKPGWASHWTSAPR